jgi:hypothetical protein
MVFEQRSRAPRAGVLSPVRDMNHAYKMLVQAPEWCTWEDDIKRVLQTQGRYFAWQEAICFKHNKHGVGKLRGLRYLRAATAVLRAFEQYENW